MQLGTQDSCKRMVMVPCHGVFLGRDPMDDGCWVQLPYQVGNARYWIEHLARAVEMVSADPQALLVLSGGYTRGAAGPFLSEARSYAAAAEACHWWSHPSVRTRCLLEEGARDSLENLTFALCRFHIHTGCYPEAVDVCGWGFKSERFDLHREALRYPADQFTYHSVNNPESYKLSDALAGEEGVRAAFEKDPYGVLEIDPRSRGEAMIDGLAKKRRTRDPWNRHREHLATYLKLCPELEGLLTYDQADLYADPVPWPIKTTTAPTVGHEIASQEAPGELGESATG